MPRGGRAEAHPQEWFLLRGRVIKPGAWAIDPVLWPAARQGPRAAGGCRVLIGGSPGPNAEGTWKVLVFVLVLALGAGIGFLHVWNYMSSMSLYPTDLLD